MNDAKRYLTQKAQGRFRILQWIALLWLGSRAFMLLIGTLWLMIEEDTAAAVGLVICAVLALPVLWIIRCMRYRSKAVMYARCLSTVRDGMITFEELNHLSGKGNTLQWLRKLLAKGYMQGFELDVAAGEIYLQEAVQRSEPAAVKCECCGASLPKDYRSRAYCAYCGSMIRTR